MRGRTSGAVCIFIGALLTFCFAIGMSYSRNPGAYLASRGMDFARDQFVAFCGAWWIPCGIIGVPLLLISLIVCLIRERKENKRTP